MAHVHRFFISPETATAESMLLPDEEAHHALRVVRVQRGDPVVLFDGRGRELVCEIAEATKREVTVRVREERQHELPAHRLTVAQAWLHREKAIEFLVRHGTEMGVHRFVFWEAERSEKKPKVSEKWARWAVEVCKQAGRVWVPQFEVATNVDAVLDGAQGTLAIAAISAGHRPLACLREEAEVTLLLGPEGDFTGAELAAAQAKGAVPISLGKYIYRAEVAAVTGAALLQYIWGEMGER